MLWRLLQIALFVGVLFANIYWQITPNGYVAALFAFIIATFIPEGLWWLFELTRRLKLKLSARA